MMDPNVRLSIIIPVFNNAHFTRAALQDLIKLPKDHEIFIANNGSDDDTDDLLHEYLEKSFNNNELPSFNYVRFPENRGFSHSNNEAYHISRGENVLFLNNDIRVKSNHRYWTRDIIFSAERGKLIAAEGGLLDNNFNFIKEGNKISLINSLSYLSGWCLGGSRKTFDKLILNHHRVFIDGKDKLCDGKAKGPWNEIFYSYFEDTDLSFRARKIGIEMKLLNLPLYHFGRMTGRKLNLKELYMQSREKFLEKWKDNLNA